MSQLKFSLKSLINISIGGGGAGTPRPSLATTPLIIGFGKLPLEKSSFL